jgi:phage baseplate assembly protein W|tara:strand:+ start:37 stop:435 length:399 start_codon:yes stop_codon:yes gene_type:complete
MPKISPKLPLTVSEQGGYGFTKTIGEAVQQNFKNLVMTVPGERIMDPEFGVGLYTYLFRNATSATYESLRSRIVSQTAKYLPFINIRDIIFGTPEDESSMTTSNLLTIRIVYSIESTDQVNILTLTNEQPPI